MRLGRSILLALAASGAIGTSACERSSKSSEAAPADTAAHHAAQVAPADAGAYQPAGRVRIYTK
jgi:hypothetical protein